MKISFRNIASFSAFLVCISSLSGCGKVGVSEAITDIAPYCPTSLSSTPITSSTGTGKIFSIDPLVASGNPALSPGSSTLGNFTSTATLPNLLGYGVLKGTFVDVVSDECGQSYGAFSSSNDFRFEHGDDRFAEVMNYYYGNQFRSDLLASSVLYPTGSFYMIANCDVTDNAYYSQGIDSNGNLVDYVCMGKSSTYATTTSFSEDAGVIMHELQHGTTGNAYSTLEDFNKFDYDEAGAINEAISDFIGLIQSDPEVSGVFKNFEFSRWALGLLFSDSVMRGAAKCPVWTADYPTCGSFSKTSSGFSEAAKRISFAYPDGLGWPYAGYPMGASLKSVWEHSTGFEEIHQTAPIITGALFDIYEAIKSSSGNEAATRQRMQRLLIETIKTLPKATASDPSPVTMPVLGAKLILMAASGTAGVFTGAEQTLISNALSARGLISIPTVADGFASIGPYNSGSTDKHPGLYFYDTFLPPLSVRNYRMQAGEKGMVWFDIANSSANSAAAPLLKVTSSDSRIRFSDATMNPGYVSNTVAFIRYGKLNGSDIVTAMNNGAGAHTGITNSYFSGNTLLGVNNSTALYIEIAAGTPSNTSFNFTVEITPANKASASSTVIFPVTVR